MSAAAKPLSSTVQVTKRGRRFAVCPSCSVLGAPIPIGADRFTCRACGSDFEVSAKPVRQQREVAP
jgi:hypothetical protein